MANSKTYVGIDEDMFGGMTTIGKVIRDAWVFELIPESQTCKGWQLGGLDALMQRVNEEWDKYGCLASRLPEPLRSRHQAIHDEAIKRAKAAGWSGEFETGDEV